MCGGKKGGIPGGGMPGGGIIPPPMGGCMFGGIGGMFLGGGPNRFLGGGPYRGSNGGGPPNLFLKSLGGGPLGLCPPYGPLIWSGGPLNLGGPRLYRSPLLGGPP